MKTRRRKRRSVRRNPVLLNPTKRRRRPRRITRARRRTHNPRFVTAKKRQRRRYLRRRRYSNGLFSFLGGRRRRRNPSGLIGRGFALATAAAAIQFALMWVPPIGGVSAVADAGRTAALGWIAGTVMRRTGILAAYADDVTLAAFTLAGGKMITAFVLPFANRIFAASVTGPEQMPMMAGGNQMKGIGMYDPKGQPFRRYQPLAAGMNGIATYAPTGQPYGMYALVA